jgi:hypothetical protein
VQPALCARVGFIVKSGSSFRFSLAKAPRSPRKVLLIETVIVHPLRSLRLGESLFFFNITGKLPPLPSVTVNSSDVLRKILSAGCTRKGEKSGK